jgi:hypothetical protein
LFAFQQAVELTHTAINPTCIPPLEPEPEPDFAAPHGRGVLS